MARPSKTDQERGFLRSAWDVMRVLQADYQGVVTVYANTTGRPGVFTIRFVFTPLAEDAENYLGANAVQFDFPTASTSTLAATFFAQAMKLQQLVADSYVVIKRHRLPRA
jgi:hypothetical protein